VQPVAGKWAQIVRAGVSGEIEARICRPNGDARFFLIRTTPIRDEKGAIVKWYGTATDIEDLKRAEQASREAQAQLAHINRVATMGQLTASIAHEVNQPIAATVANAQAALRWLEKDPPNLGEVRQSLDDIVSSGNRAGDVVARIRALVKNAAPQTDHLDMNEAIREVIALTRSEAVKNRVALQVQFAERLPSIEGDRVQLQQVMLNLIINAIEAIGAIDEGSRELLISTGRAEAGGVFVAVRDSGAGLSPQDLEHVFDAFYTTKSGGMGMGLAICRSIIEAHGGRVWATPNTPRGATFQFNVPASPPTGLKE
jgi:C4-dicarboxylate-specific signal transduction histidine kinase